MKTRPRSFESVGYAMIAKIGKLIRRNIPLTLAAVVAVTGIAFASVRQFEAIRIKTVGVSTNKALDIGKTASTSKFSVTNAGNMTVAGTSSWTGLITATGGVTTPANYTTTGSGSLVVGGTGTASVAGLSTLTGGLTTPANVTITGTGKVNQTGNGANVFTGDIQCTGGLWAGGNSALNSTINITAGGSSTGAFAFNGWAQIKKLQRVVEETASRSSTSADFGKVIIWSGAAGAGTITLPAATSVAAGTQIRVLSLSTNTCTINAATADTLIAPGKPLADPADGVSITDEGSMVRFVCTGGEVAAETATPHWVAIPEAGTMTVIDP